MAYQAISDIKLTFGVNLKNKKIKHKQAAAKQHIPFPVAFSFVFDV